ncbi:MAG: threonine synthase [Alphaproteobacteria bacterium]|nr:threonine synthase [Alphaproteobacteria bacterium]
MRYISTRGQAAPASFSEILLEGLASDGGLYMPETWPTVTFDELEAWKSLPYADLAAKLLAKFATDIPPETLLMLTRAAYTPEVFQHARNGEDAKKIFPVRQLEKGIFLLQLSNGPTLAFKDAAMQILGQLLSWALEKQNKTLTILGATSGDTGSAAIHALRGKKRVKVAMLSPAGRMSDFQRAQMYSVLDANVMNIAVKGMFDDCQDLVKTLNADSSFKAKHHLGAVNSINWARVVAQTAYYISAYLQTIKVIGDSVSFCVPSGNFGNAFAGLVAKFMGVPIDRIIVATNENDVLHRALQTGRYTPTDVAQATSSPSMDITKASNFERAVFEAADHDGKLVAEMWTRLANERKIDFAKDYPAVWGRLASLGLSSSTSTHKDRLAKIKLAHERWGIFIDPHTADGVKGALELRESEETMIILETAQAGKFAPTIREALGIEPPIPKGFENLTSLQQKVETIKVDPEALKAKIDNFA